MPRGNINNLVPNSERTPEELRKITQKGGKASGAKRRKMKTVSEIMKSLIHIPLDEAQQQFFKKYMGQAEVPECEQDQLMFMLVTILKLAQKGNVKCAELVLKLIGEMPATKTEITGADGSPLSPLVLNIAFTDEAGADDVEASTDG